MLLSIDDPILLKTKDETHLEIDVSLVSGEKFGLMLSSDGNGWKIKQEKNKMISKEMLDSMNRKIKLILNFENTKSVLKKSKAEESEIETYCSDSFLKKIREMEELYLER